MSASVDVADQTFRSLAFSRLVVVRAIKVALIVGTILAFINHGDRIVTLSLDAQGLFKVALTYLVPYCVSTWSAVGALRASAAAGD